MSALASPAASPVAPPNRVIAPPSQTHGVQSLAAFVDVLANKAEAQAKDDAQAGKKGQKDAASGKALPEKDDKSDPALAWLLAAAAIVPPKPVTIALPSIPGAAVPAAPAAPAGADAPAALDAALVAQSAIVAAASAPKMPQTPAAPVEGAQPGDTSGVPSNIPSVAPSDALATPSAKIVAEQLAALPPALAAATAPSPALFTIAMAVQNEPKRDTALIDSSGAPTSANVLQPADAAAPIAKSGGAQGQALDMGRQDWPQKMIDHIEALRDGANANDTSIRLKPEALGRIDIALRTHADGAISVRFSAEQSATRSLIADATPQLSAAAEARGIRLSGTSVDLSGSGTGGDRPRPTVDLNQNISNHLTVDGEDNSAVSDGRVA